MRVGSMFGSLMLAVLLQGGAAQAEDCGPLKQINAVDLVAARPNRALIPVSINGIPKLFLFDTGGGVSQISGAVAEELKLSTRDSAGTMLDLYGHASRKFAIVDKFAVGHQGGENIRLAIHPNPDFGRGTQYVGLFSPDLMGRYDVEIDFGTYKMNYFSSDHCPGRVVYWHPAALAVTPMTFHKTHIKLPVKIDGKEVTAEIDTGAPGTTMRADAAKRLFDIVPESPGNVPLNAQGMAAAFGRVFSTLDFEGVAVQNPHIVIIPQLIGSKDPNNSARTDSRARRVDDVEDQPDVLIGMDILKKLRLYIAFDENKLYISEASAPPKQADISAPTTLEPSKAPVSPAQ
ncbi:MAG TPA: retropepsin-like aspartic protease [Rhizomicrobium sp.]|nr:retropepsin-like aspartic protease [Rhizomicrobium sp.]